PPPTPRATPDAPAPLFLSGRSKEALRAQAARLRDHLASHPDLALPDVGYSLAVTRAHFKHRAVALPRARGALLEALAALSEDRPHAEIASGEARAQGKLCALFTGQGSQRPGAGRALYAAFPSFREALDDLFAHLDPHLPRPLREVMFSEEGSAEAARL